MFILRINDPVVFFLTTYRCVQLYMCVLLGLVGEGTPKETGLSLEFVLKMILGIRVNFQRCDLVSYVPLTEGGSKGEARGHSYPQLFLSLY